MLMLRCWSLLLFTVCLFATEPQIVDKPVRYIERDMITLQDVQEQLLLKLRAEKQGIPKDRRALEALHMESLEYLTDETLLLQEADRMMFEVPENMVYSDVRSQFEEAEQVPDPRLLAVLVKQRLRMIRIHTVTKFYTDMAPNIRPEDIELYYSEHAADYQRPARWHIYQILVIPSNDERNKNVFKELIAVYKGIQDNSQAEIKALINEEVSQEFLALPFGGIEQIHFLQKICAQLLALEIPDPGPVTLQLLDAAKRWSSVAEAIRDKEQVAALLKKISNEINALDPEQRLEAFKLHAGNLTMGLGADRGGEMGMLELGGQTREFAEQLTALKANELSQVFWSGTGYVLLFAAKAEPALVRTFNEVNGEIRKLLETQQHEAVRQDLLQQLREKATIQDIE